MGLGAVSIWHLFGSPIQCFRARVESPPAWRAALAPVMVHAASVAIVAAVALYKVRVALAPGLEALGVDAPPSVGVGVTVAVVSSMVAAVGVFWVLAGGVAVADVLFAQSGQARRLVEFTGLAYVTQVPWGLANIAIAFWWFDPGPLQFPGSVGAADLPRLLTEYHAALGATSLQLTLRLVGVFFTLWVVALQGCALRVVSGFTAGGAWATGTVMGLFVMLPWAWQRFG